MYQTRPSHQNYISSSRFPKFPGTGRSKGLAYVEFYLQEATLKALALSGQPIKGQARQPAMLHISRRWRSDRRVVVTLGVVSVS
jgi:hypothetical protein